MMIGGGLFTSDDEGKKKSTTSILLEVALEITLALQIESSTSTVVVQLTPFIILE